MYSSEILVDVKSLLNKKTIILGEVGSGKTKLTAKIVEQLVREGCSNQITVIDMAPPKIGNIGGLLKDYLNEETLSKIKYLKPPIVYAPRTTGKTREEVLEKARANTRAIKPLLQHYLQNPTKILIINDLSIYLHQGPLEDIINCLETAETFIANAYYGHKLADDKNTGISAREKALLEKLLIKINKIIVLQ